MFYFRIYFIVLAAFQASMLFGQLPEFQFKNLAGKEMHVTKVSVTPLMGSENGEPYTHIIRDSTKYAAVIDSVHQNSDSTYMITVRIVDLRKTITSGREVLVRDTLKDYKLRYLVDLKGAYLEPQLDKKLARSEGYLEASRYLRTNEMNAADLAGNQILWNYRSYFRYRDLKDIKQKVFQELFWIHLFPGLNPIDKTCWRSSQASYVDLKMDRVPSKLTFAREGQKISVHQEIDVVALYKGKVADEELKILAEADPENLITRIHSDAEYLWNKKLDIPNEINATLTTTINNQGNKASKIDRYMIVFKGNE